MVKAVIFTDFDGTVTQEDSNDYLTDNLGFGKEKRLKVFDGVIDGTTTFRDAFSQMLDSIHTPFPECLDILTKHIDLDPGFKDTLKWSLENNVPIVVVSSGMRPIIKHLLTSLVGEDSINKIDIVSNEVDIHKDGEWNIVYIDDGPFGHDKSKTIDRYKRKYEAESSEKPIYFYCGDGVSDLSAAKDCDLLFARRGKDLVRYCKKQDVPFREFDSFEDILASIKQVLSGKKTVKELMEN
ncbi:YNL010W [Zygosaccharomyces parabailii]|uniref:ZYBA0S06-01112g1_1 n=1 Tax=Zygosaccharomyces bailii (strain CLIB 213 / ATCC 58445 / CBS 680 / BCRC 21525 / NBRC 1098 / NCYC 1416 / NRRL Y-2227) TaxID=1333698 RepID=A0A8J2X8T1_ZYGB2|nr:YNL010W [Zygosaccharomyces parabailii]CDF90125.1 ZYBA0S06-01112g1_1 [Zygosaccharomyces bailii CLIB 213]CDH16654.1 related to Phosphoserine phosphatase [Zygosaccharomyces bailii ISA1307]SJM87198.1 related to Pdp3-interacting factor 1 [Zygosaccharomyces bailii]